MIHQCFLTLMKARWKDAALTRIRLGEECCRRRRRVRGVTLQEPRGRSDHSESHDLPPPQQPQQQQRLKSGVRH